MNLSILDELPVKMHAATEDKDITMRQIHRTCGSRRFRKTIQSELRVRKRWKNYSVTLRSYENVGNGKKLLLLGITIHPMPKL